MSGVEISAVDLFCGVGGLTKGLSDAGIDVKLGVDIELACQFPFEKNNSATFLQADINQIRTAEISDLLKSGGYSLLAGCAPCQPFSTYSRSAKVGRLENEGGAKTEDWRLVKRFGEIISETQPDLVTMENVPPLAHQEVFQEFLSYLDGYYYDWQIVDCSKLGLPQTRRRLVILASKLAPITLPEFDAPENTVRMTIKDLPPISAGEIVADDPLHRACRLSEMNLARIRASKPGGTWRDWPDELRAECHRKASGATYPSVYGRMNWDKPAPTITTQCFGYGNGRFGHPEQDRAISLREAAMLQGFPKDYAFIPTGASVSFSKLGRLIGNAVPVTLGKILGELLFDHIKKARMVA